MGSTEEMFNEFDIENVGETNVPDAKKATADKEKAGKETPYKEKRNKETPKREESAGNEAGGSGGKKNPFRFVVIFLGILLAFLLIALAGIKYYKDYVKKGEGETASSGKVDQEALDAALEEAARKQEKELVEKLLNEREQGVSEGEAAVLAKLKESIENGNSVVETLRSLYKDQLVVASGGTYHFIPVDPALKKNDYLPENLMVKDNGELQYFKDGAVVSYKGIDVSKFQGKIDWQKVAEDGVTFAIIRVGFRGYGEKGVLVEDETALQNLQGANEAGIKTGVYFYTQAITEEEAREEANMVLQMVNPYRIDCPIVIDVEKVSSSGARMNKLDKQTRTDIVKVFCETVKAAGYRPMIYHNLEMATIMLDVSQLEEYDKWFAYYKNELYYPYDYKVWQYSDTGRVNGVSGNVDLNIAFEPIW